MQNLWSDSDAKAAIAQHAAKAIGENLALRVYTTRLLGGEPRHDRGVVSSEPGLYFVGLQFLYAMSSPMIQGVGRDARHIADTIAARPPTLISTDAKSAA